VLRPGRQQAEQIAQVDLGIDSVHAGAREQGNEDGVYERRVVAADEEPVFPAQNFTAQVKYCDVVC
jgi:hypothetical protein